MGKNGCTGRLLRVDLERSTLQVTMIEPDALRLFPGSSDDIGLPVTSQAKYEAYLDSRIDRHGQQR